MDKNLVPRATLCATFTYKRPHYVTESVRSLWALVKQTAASDIYANVNAQAPAIYAKCSRFMIVHLTIMQYTNNNIPGKSLTPIANGRKLWTRTLV